MKSKKIGIIIAIIAVLGIICIGTAYIFKIKIVTTNPAYTKIAKHGTIDDWEYTAAESQCDNISSVSSSGVKSSSNIASKVTLDCATEQSTGGYIGYTVGGASNVDSLRQNIKNGYLPISTDITYNGIYSEYYFNTGDVDRSSNEMFYPSYSMAVSTNPLTGEKEYYMSIGLNSNIKASDFKRPKVNLVVVLDISGSMSSPFNSYYYDGEKKRDFENKNKMKIAEECVNNLIDKLNSDDRIGIVLFDNKAYVGKKITEIGETDIGKLKEHILDVVPNGGTNFSAGYNQATNLFDEYLNDEGYQNRIIVITDAMPNLGETSSDGLYKSIEKNANNKIYTSFVGVGVDFNTNLTEKLSDIRGANYYSVHNAKEFNKTLAEDFDYMITPLIYDLDLNFKSEYYEIENVYGSDSVNKSTGNLIHINTLFPSNSNSNGEVKGGIVVLKLKKIKDEDSSNMELKISYKDVEEREHSNSEKVKFKKSEEDYYDNLGIRKAIALARYVNLIKYWIVYERSQEEEFRTYDSEYLYDDDYVKSKLGINERASKKLEVSESYKEQFKIMKKYIETEMNALNDKDLNNEIEILNKLI